MSVPWTGLGDVVTLIVCTFDDTKVELTEDQRDAMYLQLGPVSR